MADHVVVARGGIGTKAVNTNYPYDEGLALGTTKTHGRDPKLQPERSVVAQKDQVGL